MTLDLSHSRTREREKRINEKSDFSFSLILLLKRERDPPVFSPSLSVFIFYSNRSLFLLKIRVRGETSY